VIELPRAPTDVNVENLILANSTPIDVLEGRSGVATLVLCHPSGFAVQAQFDSASSPIDASDSIPVDTYTVLEISKATRYMTLFGNGATSVYWYVV